MNAISFLRFIIILAWITTAGCNSSPTAPEAGPKNDTGAVGEPVADPLPATPVRPPIINITDTLETAKLVLCVRDSASAYERIAPKLGEIYLVKIGGLIGKSGLRITGKPMAWFTKQGSSYFFEAGFPVDKKPAKLPPQYFFRETRPDSVTLAHFYGPYQQVAEGYLAVEEYLRNNYRKIKGKPYEVYVDDPMDKDGKPKDPWKVQTDIVFPWK